MQNISKSIEACAARYGEQAEAMRDYLVAGERAALALDNRGPIEFDDSGKLAQHTRFPPWVMSGERSKKPAKRASTRSSAEPTSDETPGAECSETTGAF